MVRRRADARFMGGAHVFPGGALDPVDFGDLAAAAVKWSGDPAELPWRAAALRELAEEAGVVLTDPPLATAGTSGRSVYEAVAAAGARLDAERLAYLSNWVTPRGLPVRFDTRFFLAVVEPGTVAGSDDAEVFDAMWVAPDAALDRGRRGDWQIEFPTRAHLELLAGMESAGEAWDHARSIEPRRVEPRLARDSNGSMRVLLPDDPEYAEATGAG